MPRRSDCRLRRRAVVVVACLAAGASLLLAVPASAAMPKAKALRAGEVLSGALTALRSGPKSNRTITYQLTSSPRRLPPPHGMCNLETGPEIFEIVAADDIEATALKHLIGRTVSIKIKDVVCAHEAGQLSDAIVTKWSVVAAH